MDFSLKKSFKSYASLKSSRKVSANGTTVCTPEELPILLDSDSEDRARLLDRRLSMTDTELPARSEVIVKIDDGDSSIGSRTMDSKNTGGNLFRNSSYDFWNDVEDGDSAASSTARVGDSFDLARQRPALDDPPSKLIGQFLHQQKASGDISLDMDLEMDELCRDKTLPPVVESPVFRTSREIKVSFQPNNEANNNDMVRRRYRDSLDQEEHERQQKQDLCMPSNVGGNHKDGGAEVVKCTSNSSFQSEYSFQRNSGLLKTKTRSRLLDPPAEPDKRSDRMRPKSGQVRSGLVSRVMDDEEDDPFLGEDLPDEYKKADFSIMTLLQWVSLILIIAALVVTLYIPFLRRKNLWKLKLWKWELMIFVLICGRLVSGWGIRIVVFFIERNFLLRKRVLYFVYGIRKAVQNCLWLGLVLTAWHLLFDKKVERETNSKALEYVTKILVCLLVGTLLWLVKTLIIKVLASSFHVSTYFDRIQDSLFNQYVIETLSGPPLIEIQKNEEDDEKLANEVRKLQNAGATVPPDLKETMKGGRVIGSGGLQKSPRGKSEKLSRAMSNKGDEGISIDHLHKLSPRNVSAWKMKRLIKLVRNGALSTLDEQIRDSTQGDESVTKIRSEVEAKTAARRIFLNVAKHGNKYIYLEDIMRFMREDEALKTLNLFEGASESRRISKASLKNWVVNAFRERRALALTLNDTKTAVNKLHQTVNVVVGIVIVVIWLLILEIATSKFLLFVSSQLVLVAFVFGNTCKTVFEAIIFLFSMHPFDVGDRCEIDGVQMVVEEMNILTTVFLRYDNQKIMYPNSVLATKAIHNFYRSPDMGDGVEFCLHISTPAEKIAVIRQRILSYIENKKEHWHPNPMIVVKDVEELNKLRIAVWLTHRMNHQDMGERWARRALLVEEMARIFRELDIPYRLYPLDINVRSMPHSSSPGFLSN